MTKEPIAIVGAACRFPGAADIDEFWQVLSAGRDCVTEIPDGRWSKEFYYHPNPAERGKSYTWAAGVIDNIDRFDAAFFGMSPREAEQVDPQQRLLLELTWEALEDGGIPAAKLAGCGAGVYIGASGSDYANARSGDPAGGDAYFMTGTTSSILANRLSYIFDLHGPSFTVDTACSSSLVALHLACEALRSGEVSAAIVGGVNLLLSPYPFLGFCRASMLSPDGRCFAFDKRANGYVRAEGAGIVLLKPLRQAEADGDVIRGVILGTGVNSDGRTVGLSLPSQAAQAALLRQVYDESEISPDLLSFVEAHGTGTAAGDPIELSAIGRVLGQRRAAPLPVGSVKTNVGHLETASGMAGLIKVMLGLERRILPPSIHFETPSPYIPFAELNVAVADRLTPLDAEAPRLLAGVNSFGFGGTNAHAILASPPPRTEPVADSGESSPPLLLSARSQAALAAMAGEWAARLEAPPADAASLLRAAARRRDHHQHRLVAWADGPATLASDLRAYGENGPGGRVASGMAVAAGKLAFVFSGNGAQWVGMAQDALAHSRVFRETLEEVDAILEPMLGWSVVERLGLPGEAQGLERTDVAQPLLFAVQAGIVAALRAAGVEARAHIGHSVGEIAAAYAAGALSLETACRIVVARSEQQQRTHGAGRMVALGLGPDRAAEVIARLGGGLELGAINSDNAVTISGSMPALSALLAEAEREGWRAVLLDFEYAFHSTVLDPIRDDLIARLAGIAPSPSHHLLVSTVTGKPIGGEQLGASYWWHNVRDPVRFRDAVRHLVENGHNIFLEIGPSPILQSYLRDALRSADIDGRVLGSLQKRTGASDPFPAIAANCHAAGYDLSASALFDGPATLVGLPRYPWQRERHWFAATPEAVPLAHPLRDHPLLGFRWNSESNRWSGVFDVIQEPWLADHTVEGLPVMPAVAMVEMALAAARAAYGEAPGVEVVDFEVTRALTFEAKKSREIRTLLDSERRIEIASRSRLSHEPWLTHATARIGLTGASGPAAPEPFAVTRVVDKAEVYAFADSLGLHYGPRFQVVSRVDVDTPDHAIVHLDAKASEGFTDGYILSPIALDGVLHGFLALQVAGGEGTSLLPWRFNRLRAFAPYGRVAVRATVTVEHRGSRSICGTMALYDSEDKCIAESGECWFRRVLLNRQDSVDARSFHFTMAAAPRPADGPSPAIDLAPVIEAIATEDPAADASSTELLFDAYRAASAHVALTSVLPVDAPFLPGTLVESGIVHEESLALLTSLLLHLERHELAVVDDGCWRIVAESDLPEPAVIWRTLLEEGPEMVAELTLLAANAATLPQLLRFGPEAGTAPPATFVDQLLYGSPAGRKTIESLCEAVMAVAAQWPAGHPLRILEIGAGTGALSRTLVARLESWPGTLSYLATDPDPDLAARLGAFAEGRWGVSAMRWDPRDPGAGATPSGHFDIVLTAYGLTRNNLDGTALAALRGLVAPNGVLLATEPLPNAVWDGVFGVAPGWWRASLSPDFPISPLRDQETWSEALRGAGFVVSPGARLAATPWAVNLLAASRPGEARTDEAPRSSASALIIASHDDPLARDLSARLSAAGMRPEIIVPPEVADGAEFCAALAAAGSELPEIIMLPSRGGPATAIAADAAARMVAVLTVSKLAADVRDRTRFWVVTTGAQQGGTTASKSFTPREAGLWGLARTVANETPQIDCRLIDLHAGAGAGEMAERIAAEVLAPDGETEIAWTTAGRHALRLRRGLPAADQGDGPAMLAVAQPGLLDTLYWKRGEPVSPGPGSVSIEVHAAGLNFRDVMWAQGILPEEALLDGFAGPTLGLECAGVVRETGSDVVGLRPGDRVMALAPAALASHVVTPQHAVVPLPAEIDFAAAATIPVAYLTTVYALGTLARLEAGEHVLIHGAAGGVGLAAIQYAKYRGAIVIATAGSAAKREFLRQLGVDHVLDSRSLEFADAVMALTGNRGVEVVLNSLNGDAMERSLGLLRPFGRFLELGKRDFYMNTRVGLRPLRQNVAYFAVDVDRLPVERPAIAAGLLREVIELMATGALRPLPHRVFSFAEAAAAFRLMQGAGHIGKIVLVPERRSAAKAAPAQRALTIRPDATYLVTGGTSGFGLETARWLAARGARHIALMSRRGADAPAAGEAIAALRASVPDVRAFACDVADAAALKATLAELRRAMPPLRGVVHAAMVVDDALVGDLTGERIQQVLAPKMAGAANLDRLTRKDPIEIFLLYSSATTVLGAPGQGSYVAANLGIEAIARRRAAEGLPALAVGWGPISDAGYLARQDETREALQRRLAATPMTAAQALEALPALWASGLPVIAFAPVQWDSARRLLPILNSPTFAGIASSGAADGDGNLRERLAGLPPEEKKEIVVGLLIEEVARILATSAERIDRHRPLSEFGMDSLMAVELRLALESRLSVNLPLLSLSDSTTLSAIAARIVRSLSDGLEPASGAVVEAALRHEVAEPDAIASGTATEEEPAPVAATAR